MKCDRDYVDELVIDKTGMDLDEFVDSLELFEEVDLRIIDGFHMEIKKSLNEEMAKDLKKDKKEEYTFSLYHKDLENDDLFSYPGGYFMKVIDTKEELKETIVQVYYEFEDYMDKLIYMYQQRNM